MAYQPSSRYDSGIGYRDAMLKLIQSRSAGVLREKKKMEQMQKAAEREQAGKWGDVAMLGASLGGMIGSALGPGGAGMGMGIGAGAGALLGGIRGLVGGASAKDMLKGAIPSQVQAATGMSSMAQTLAGERARMGDMRGGTSGAAAAARAAMPPTMMPGGAMGPAMGAAMSRGIRSPVPTPSMPAPTMGGLGPVTGQDIAYQGMLHGVDPSALAPPPTIPPGMAEMLRPGMLGQPMAGLPGAAAGIRGY